MADLAARAFLLAVEVNPGVGHPREQVVQPLVEGDHRRRLRRAQHVGHHRYRRDGVGVAERIVQHRAQMLLELAGSGAVHGPVAGVVRTHRQLVDQQGTVGGLEQLDGEHTDDAEFGGQAQRQRCAAAATSVGQRRRGRDHQHADAVGLHRLHHRPCRALTERRASHQRRQFAAQVHPLLDHHRHPIGQEARLRSRGRAKGHGHPHPAPVVTAADRFDDHRTGYALRRSRPASSSGSMAA